jgi:Rrf2 family protein
MRVSAKGEYGVKVMAFLASREGSPLSLQVISQECRVPFPFLAQIMLKLKRAQLVSSLRGSKGGYFLSRAPQEIKVKEILEALGGETILVECLSLKSRCPSLEECLTRPFWMNLKLSLEKLLEVSLAELTQNKKEVRHR